MAVNPALLDLARHQVWKEATQKQAAVPAGGGAPPPGMDPAMMGGAPPGAAPPGMDPAMMGGAPPPGGAPMGGAPMDPAMMGGAPPPQPGMAPSPMMPDPTGMGMAGQTPQKMKPEQMMQMLDFRLYNMQMQLTAVMNALNVQLPPGALVTPPGSPTPVAEAAVPGGPQDPGVAGGGGAGAAAGDGSSAISPIDPIQGASPEAAAGGQKTASDDSSFSDFITLMTATVPAMAEPTRQSTPKYASVGQPYGEIMARHSTADNVSAVAALLRQRTAGRQ